MAIDRTALVTMPCTCVYCGMAVTEDDRPRIRGGQLFCGRCYDRYLDDEDRDAETLASIDGAW